MDKTQLGSPDISSDEQIENASSQDHGYKHRLTGEDAIVVDPTKVANLAVAIWRAQRRAARNSETPEAVLLSCETAVERLSDIGVELDDMVGQPYSENLRVHVVDSSAGSDLRIIDCLSPAVYISGQLARPAEVIVGS